jgi:hypothetical protein
MYYKKVHCEGGVMIIALACLACFIVGGCTGFFVVGLCANASDKKSQFSEQH